MTKKTSKPVAEGGKKTAKNHGKKETAKASEKPSTLLDKVGKKTAKKDKDEKKISKKKSKKERKQSALREELRDLTGAESRRDILRISSAIILLIVTAFLLLSLVSNIFTGAEDQAGVLSGTDFEAANKGGYLGAIVSYYFMNQLFGFGSLLFPLFLACVVVKLILRDECRIRLWMVFIHSVIIAFLISLDATYLQNNVLPDQWCSFFGFELGGMHGHDLVGMVESLVGSTITFIFLLLLTVGYIGYWFTQVYIWIVKGVRKLGPLIPTGAKNDDDEDDDDETPDASDETLTPAADTDNAKTSTDIIAATAQSRQTVEFEVNGVTAAAKTSTSPFGADIPAVEDTPSLGSSVILDLTGGSSEADEEIPMLGDENDPFAMGVTSKVDVIPTSADTIPSVGGAASSTSGTSENPNELILIEGVEEKEAGEKTAESLDDELKPYDPKLDLERYQYPPIDLLQKHTSSGNPTTMEELEANKTRIIEVLSNFGVAISKISATVGPTVTLYEITPAPGVRIAKIRNLEDDIALSLSALGIRIIAPIPGKGTIGIEVPNENPQVVSMESIVNTQKFKETKYELPIALGKTITNEMFMVDLAKMPHLLVAGATGQGKSVGLNAIITSLLYKKHPSELKIVMIDPKKVEFSMYNPIINHFLAQVPDSDEPVVTDVKKVINTLKSLCQEMDDRYDLLKNAHCRNIKEYNAKFCERHLLPTEGHRFLPYIVVIIDEFGDLIMTAGKEIELPIARIAQLARAVGIHMVIATQSPRATIITGKIKANFPARMAFRVSQGIESQTILDRRGANNLIGKGDMLFQAGSELTRVQCAFVDTPEVVAIAKHISEQQGYPAPFELPLVADDGGDGTEGISSQNGESTFEQVARFVVNTQQGSTSKIQRTFSVGFNRAGRLMDQLEEAGIVGPQQGSKPREVLVQSEVELRRILDALKEAGQNFD